MKTKLFKIGNFEFINQIVWAVILATLVSLSSCETSSLSELAEDSVTEQEDTQVEEEAGNQEEEQETEDPDNQEEEEEDGDQSNLVTYENRAMLILDNACVECHNSVTATAGIRLDNFSFARDVAESGRMIARMTDQSNPMPPSGNLPDSIIDDIMQWIDDGLLEN